MLGRKTFTKEEIAHARTTFDEQLAAYRKLPATTGATAFEPLFFNNLALALDRFFVHRLRVVTGKDGTALNELELICDSLMNNGGVLRGSSVIKYVPEQSVVKLRIGDRIRLTAADFERLSVAVFTELDQKFLER